MKLSHVSSIAVISWATLSWALPAVGAPLVDCSKKEFQVPNSARSLFLWTAGAEERILKAKRQGVFGVKPEAERGDAVSTLFCPKMISYRGTAHCKEPANEEYRSGLARLLEVCAEASKPAQASGLVDCKDPRFTNAEATVDLLLRWTDSALRGLEEVPAHEGFRIKVKCDQALQYASTAHCKAPSDPRPPAALAKVREKCAAVQTAREAKEKAQAEAAQAQVAAQKANRKIVPMPRSTYRGGDAAAVAGAMKQALLASRLAKSPKEILKVQPMGGWASGRYTDTRRPYKKITGIVLWWDDDKDGVCRFVSYNFVKEPRGPLKSKSFCLGCQEGWTRCR